MANQTESMFEVAMAADHTLPPKQKQILRASLDLFAEKGFDRTSTSDIASRAGVAEGTVYRHYRNKEALRMAVITPMVENVVPTFAAELVIKEMTADYSTLEAFLKTVMEERLHFVQVNQKELKVLFEVLLFTEDIRKQMFSILGPKIAKNVFDAIETLKQRHIIADLPTDIILQSMISMLLGFFGRTVMGLPGAELQRQVDYVVLVLSKALAPTE